MIIASRAFNIAFLRTTTKNCPKASLTKISIYMDSVIQTLAITLLYHMLRNSILMRNSSMTPKKIWEIFRGCVITPYIVFFKEQKKLHSGKFRCQF